ncbi:MAG: DUF4834 family protein [Bacteroidales bacterium]|nr:DUF4834 family protein [Bacteroidales bacterium]
MAFLRTLLILMLFYYGFKLIVKFLLPFFAQRWVKKAQNRYNEQQGFTNPDEAKQKEGEVNISGTNKQKTNSNQKEDLGDYIEFEEVKEDK